MYDKVGVTSSVSGALQLGQILFPVPDDKSTFTFP